MKIEIIKEIDDKIIKFSNKIINKEYAKDTSFIKSLYKKKNVECVIAKDLEKIVGCCFLLPKKLNGEKIYWLFNLFSENKKGSGLIMIKYIMKNYNNICCIGVTKQAELIYSRMGWGIVEDYYRYFKILNINYFFSQYKERLNYKKKLLIIIYYYIVELLSKLNINALRTNYDYVIVNKILRITNNIQKINFAYELKGGIKKSYVGIEFLSNKKQNLTKALLNGYIRINSPIYFYSKDNFINKSNIMQNILSFKDTDKLF